jgi:exodeoxyribonuclease V alpha subunit
MESGGWAVPRRRSIGLEPPRGRAGAGVFNALLHQRLTPSRQGVPERRAGRRMFRLGNRVTRIRNNYDNVRSSVLNGTVGVVAALNSGKQTETVRTDEDEPIGFDEARQAGPRLCDDDPPLPG